MKSSSLLKSAALLAALTGAHAAAAQTVDAAQDPQIDSHIRPFLKALNASGGKPLEQLPPKEARAVLTARKIR